MLDLFHLVLRGLKIHPKIIERWAQWGWKESGEEGTRGGDEDNPDGMSIGTSYPGEGR